MRSFKFLCIFFVVVALSLASLWAVSYGNDIDPGIIYRSLKEISSFGIVAVSLVGDAHEAGLNEDEVSKFIHDKFKGYFAGFPYEDLSKDSSRFWSLVLSRERKVGNVTFRVWVVGKDYPIAYHIRCDAGNFENPSIWSEEILGHGSKANTRDAIMQILDEMMRNFATTFFNARA